MAVFDRMSRQEIESRYQHYGWFCGLVPVYVGDLDTAPVVDARNGCPEWWFSVVHAVFMALCGVLAIACPAFEPEFPIIITGETGKSRGSQ